TDYPGHLGAPITLPILLEVYGSSVNPATPDWRVSTIEIVCNDPLPGQQILNEYVFTGDGIRSDFFLQFGYLGGSVRLEVDGIDQQVTEVNGTTGEGARSFTPPVGEVVRAFYQAAG